MEGLAELAKAVIGVMKDVRGMEKGSHVGSGRSAYDGTKDQDVKDAFNSAMVNHGLCILPVEIKEETKIDRWEAPDPYKEGKKVTKQSVFTKVLTRYLLLHESGQSKIISGYGHGVDPQDKGAGKATTYALKNALLLTFLTPVGKMPDTDETHSGDIETKPSQNGTRPKAENEITKDYKFLHQVGMVKAELFEAVGGEVGEKLYRAELKIRGCKKSNELLDRKDQVGFYQAIGVLIEESKKTEAENGK